MALLNSIFSWIIKQRIHQIELFIKYPHEVQEDWLFKLLTAGRNTEWGQKYDYQSVKSADDYRNRLPVQNYESIKPYILRLRQGEENLLWNSDIKWFAKSSGTTSDKSKFIPVSMEALEECHFKGGKDLLSIYCNNYPDTQMFNGKLLSLGGSHRINSFSNESFYGDLSAILIQNLPFWIQLLRTPDISIALMDEWEEKIDRMARVTMLEDVTNISGVPSWTLVLLKRVLELSDRKDLTEVWPNLELFVHGGVSFAPYRDQFQRMIPSSNMHYLETYNASEGFFGIQDRTDSEDMLLMLDYGIYYEFLNMTDADKEFPPAFGLESVELNKEYAMVISTNAGLWRYLIGDTIIFTSLSPYRIKITGRTTSFINAFGEELVVDNAEKAMAEACLRTSAVVKDYTAGPVYFTENKNGAHEWLIEFERAPVDINEFSTVLDESLKKLNSDYEAKRYLNMALTGPVLRAMPENTFYNWLKSKDKLGGQHKVPRLSNNRKIVDEILQYAAYEKTI
jgi:hypothetical protein